MKPVPLLLLLSSLLLSSQLRSVAGRPRSLPGWLDGSSRLQTPQLEEALLRAAAAAGDSSASEILREIMLQVLQNRNQEPLRLLTPEEEETEEEEAVRAAAAQLLKRSEGPQLSIDLTHHLRRNMIQMAKEEKQRVQAQLNRIIMDEVGK